MMFHATLLSIAWLTVSFQLGQEAEMEITVAAQHLTMLELGKKMVNHESFDMPVKM